MKNTTEISGLSYRGNGFFAYEDTSSPRMSNLDVAIKIGKGVGRRVQHISSNAYEGKRLHVLQYSHLYKKDMERESQKLASKFNTH